MSHRSRQSTTQLRAMKRMLVILFVLAVGPLQAQTLFACAMMDIVVTECCCGDEPTEMASNSDNEPCCDRSVTVMVDHDLRHDSPVAKPAKVETDPDPPPLMAITISISAPVAPAAPAVRAQRASLISSSGSNTYLLTRRLRI